MAKKVIKHILGLSGGKDSAALALYLKDKIPEIEYFFCDTHKELKETYEFLYRLEARLGKKITWLEPDRGFDHWLDIFGGYLPSPQNRWCTRQLKLKPMEKFIGDELTYSYIAIRADENRSGYISTKSNIKPIFPFIDDNPGIYKADVIKILEDSGVGLPKYYEWRSRSGCYFCFFQRKIEWVRLAQKHPKLFKEAQKYECEHKDGRTFYWNQNESLAKIYDRRQEIIDDYNKKISQDKSMRLRDQPLIDIMKDDTDIDDDNFCFVCNL